MKGRLYAIGVGPGDPELLTLKAARILGEVSCIAVPTGREGGGSLALSIVEKALPLNGKKILQLHFPMVKNITPDRLRPVAEEVLSFLRERDVAFVTLGDPTLYSTFFHLHDVLLDIEPDIRAEIVPGVSSITASSAMAGISLALSGEKVAVLPATYISGMEESLWDFDTVVLMKVHSVMDDVKRSLAAKGLLDDAVYVSRAGMEGETVKPVAHVKEEDLNYFSTVIVRKKRR